MACVPASGQARGSGGDASEHGVTLACRMESGEDSMAPSSRPVRSKGGLAAASDAIVTYCNESDCNLLQEGRHWECVRIPSSHSNRRHDAHDQSSRAGGQSPPGPSRSMDRRAARGRRPPGDGARMDAGPEVGRVSTTGTDRRNGRTSHAPCYFGCGRPATVVSASRGMCAACYTRSRTTAANRPGARPIDRRD